MGGENTVVYVDPKIADIVGAFLSGIDDDIEEMYSALETSDYERIGEIGHDLKGSGGGDGFDRITQLGKKLRNAVNARHDDHIQTLLEKLEVCGIRDGRLR